MTHAPHPPRRSQAPLRRYRALVAALAVMLLAVLPHVTFAASVLHGIARPSAADTTIGHVHAMGDGSGSHASATRCHEPASVEKSVAPAKPPCCIIGCGLIGVGLRVALPRIVLISHRLPPPPALRGEGAMIEPAERPPRSA